MKKQILIFSLALAATGLWAAEANLINNGSGDTTADGWPTAKVNSELALSGGGCLEFADRKWVYSDQSFDIDDSKTYKLKMNLRSREAASPSSCFIGIAMYDADGKLFGVQNVAVVKNTETILNEEIAKGATEFKVANGANWKLNNHVFYDVKSDFSDLPNRKLLGVVGNIEPVGSFWNVTLKAPARAALPAGTAVRQHVSSSGNAYCIISNKPVPAEWTEYSAVITGRAQDGEFTYTKFWPGAKTFKICFVPNYNKKVDSALLVDDMSLTIEE